MHASLPKRDRIRSHRVLLAVALIGIPSLASCSADDVAPPEPLFPRQALTEWVEARDCRHSHEHELRYIRVLADPAALPVYASMTGTYPVGATLLKLEYDEPECAEIVGFSVMQKLPLAADPDRGDWAWQRLEADRTVVPRDPKTCVACHKHHCREEDGTGLDLSCAEEL